MKGIIIDEPWISMILSGDKTWEMRKTANHDRGLVALIRKGSGHVAGTARVTGSLPPISPADYPKTVQFHCIHGERQTWASSEGYLVPWVIEGARPLTCPVPYKHKKGAQSRVVLDEAAAVSVRRQLSLSEGESSAVPSSPRLSVQATSRSTPLPKLPTVSPAPSAATGAIGERVSVAISQGNLNNNHFYLKAVLDFFPDDAVGGCDATQIARRLLNVDYEGVGAVVTDITGPDLLNRPGRSKHCFFRERGPVKQFFKMTGAQPGDLVVIERRNQTSFRVTLEKSSTW